LTRTTWSTTTRSGRAQGLWLYWGSGTARDVNAGGPPGTPPSDRRARVDEIVERLAASGATLVTAGTEYDEYCVTMLDPEGNEFDVQ
jgi:hypothetical protein